MESSKEDFEEFTKNHNHSIYLNKNADSRKVVPVSLDTDEVDCYDSTDSRKSIFSNGDNFNIDDIIISRMHTDYRKAAVHKAVSQLDTEEQYIIQEIFFMGRTQRELAKELDKSYSAMSERYHKILEKLKAILGEENWYF